MATRLSQTAIVAEWQCHGPALLSREDIVDGSGQLACDYTDNVDTRWSPQTMLGPLKNQVSLAAAGGTTVEANGAALSGGMHATLFLYIIRGTKWAKVKVSDWSLKSDNTETALGSAATSILYTQNPGGTEEISFGLDNTDYRVITAVGAGATDTHADNDSSVICRILGYAGDGSSVPRIAGLGRVGAAGTAMTTVRANLLTSTVTMKTPVWSTIDDIGAEQLTFTGFALDLDYWIVGTSNGPFYVDSKFNHFRNLMPEIGQDSNNCAQMTQISWLGTVVPLARGARRQYGLQTEGGIGPERYRENTSPVQGRLTGVAGNQLWGYFNVYNPTTDETYLCAVQPRQPGDWHKNMLSYYPIMTLTNTSSNFLLDIDTANGTLTNPTLIGGEDANMFYITQGRIPREPDDTNYRFAASGTWFGTELRRAPDEDKEVEYVEFETSSCSTTQTVTVSLAIDGGTAIAVGAPVTTNGYQRIGVVPGDFRGHRIKPQVAFATASSSASPKIEGNLRIIYRPYTKEVDGAERRA